MTHKYANAAKVLPKELLKEVQKHHTGMLWIPSSNGFYRERRDLVIELYNKGIKSEEIANLAGITSRRVNQILAEYKKGIVQANTK